jgi:hypothetical protein
MRHPGKAGKSLFIPGLEQFGGAGIIQSQFKYAQVSRHPGDSVTYQNQITARTNSLDNH